MISSLSWGKHIEGCCCGGEGFFEKNNDEVDENFEENGESRGLKLFRQANEND